MAIWAHAFSHQGACSKLMLSGGHSPAVLPGKQRPFHILPWYVVVMILLRLCSSGSHLPPATCAWHTHKHCPDSQVCLLLLCCTPVVWCLLCWRASLQ